jgi:vancomycin permeability regulator SanA
MGRWLMAVDYLARIDRIEAAIDAFATGGVSRLSAGGESVEYRDVSYADLQKMLRDAKAGAVRAGVMTASAAGLGGAMFVRPFGS